MTVARGTSPSAALRYGALAGLIGAVLLDAYRLGVAYVARNGTPEDHYRAVAAAVVGGGAYAFPGAAWLGVLIQVVLGVAWGIGFVWAALQAPQIARRPVIAGIAFGFVVYTVNRLAHLASLTGGAATPSSTFVDVVAYTIFFGIPIAVIVSSRLRSA
jgi:hypothetical protein